MESEVPVGSPGRHREQVRCFHARTVSTDVVKMLVPSELHSVGQLIRGPMCEPGTAAEVDPAVAILSSTVPDQAARLIVSMRPSQEVLERNGRSFVLRLPA